MDTTKLIILFVFLVSCSSGDKVEGMDLNKLRVGISSKLSISQMFGTPNETAQVPNTGEFYSVKCGSKSEYLTVHEYKMQGKAISKSGKVTLFYDKRNILCRVEHKEYDL